MARIPGRCYCGSIHLSFDASHVISQNYCHCKNCSYKHGSPFVNVIASSSINDITVTKGNEFVKVSKKPVEGISFILFINNDCLK